MSAPKRPLFALTLALCTFATEAAPARQAGEGPKTQIAILFDASGSMKGFLDRARERVAAFVESQDAAGEGTLEVALYTYGSATGDPVLVSPLTSDAESVVGRLSEVTLSGGHESCGAAMEDAKDDLQWSDRTNDARMVLVVGNEAFRQSEGNGKDAFTVIPKLLAHRIDDVPCPIHVHTLFCGPRAEGLRDKWREGARRGNGTFQALIP